MLRPFRFPIFVFALLSLTVLLAGCQAKSPEEQVAAQRAKYTVKLNSWYANVENQAMESEEPVEGEDAEGEDADEAEADDAAEDAEDAGAEGGGGEDMSDETGTEMAAEIAGPQPHTVVFDLLVVYDGRDKPLPGVTILVTHADASGAEKGSWLEFLEMPNIPKGTSHQVGFQKQGVLFEEGDQFAITLQKSVPASDRAQYREFAEAGN